MRQDEGDEGRRDEMTRGKTRQDDTREDDTTRGNETTREREGKRQNEGKRTRRVDEMRVVGRVIETVVVGSLSPDDESQTSVVGPSSLNRR
jgi:hypothetical protein